MRLAPRTSPVSDISPRHTVFFGMGGNFASGNYPGNVYLGSGATLQVNTSSSQTFTGTVSGGGMLDRWNGGTLTLAGSNTFLYCPALARAADLPKSYGRR